MHRRWGKYSAAKTIQDAPVNQSASTQCPANITNNVHNADADDQAMQEIQKAMDENQASNYSTETEAMLPGRCLPCMEHRSA